MTSLGKLTHLRRLQNPDSGRILTVAIDHAPSYGVFSGMEDMTSVIARVAEGNPDAIMLMQGPAQRLLRTLRWSYSAHPQDLDCFALPSWAGRVGDTGGDSAAIGRGCCGDGSYGWQ